MDFDYNVNDFEDNDYITNGKNFVFEKVWTIEDF